MVSSIPEALSFTLHAPSALMF